jgi:hypothetical protein
MLVRGGPLSVLYPWLVLGDPEVTGSPLGCSENVIFQGQFYYMS